MKVTSRRLLYVFVLAALMLAACSPGAPETEAVSEQPAPTEEMMESEGDAMVEEESMAEGEMAEGEMADEEMMDEEMMDEATTFVVRIENTDSEGGLTVLAPGAFELNEHPVSFFTPGEADRGAGLEALAEDGLPGPLADGINQMMAGDMMGFEAAVFNTPVGADAPGPAGPGQAYEFTIEAHPGQYLTFATMFVQSNDWFFAPGAEGIALFDMDGNPISGDITDQISLWDAGTEVNQTPGEGSDQAPRQATPNTGEDEMGVVSLVEDFADYQISVSINPQP